MKLSALVYNLKGPVLYREHDYRSIIKDFYRISVCFARKEFSHIDYLCVGFFFLQTLYLTVFVMLLDDDRQNMTLL